jgi:hypothetical protein
LVDAVRGPTKALFSNRNVAQVTDAGYLSSFDSNGFTVVSDNDVNGSSYNYVGWAWDAGTSTVSNTDGSITSNVRASQTSGFSIASYTGNGTAGATIGHNLNAVPKWIITKCSSNDENWRVYTETTGNTKSLFISTYEIPNSSSNYWNSTSPTSSVFSVGNDSGSNNNGYTYIAYCFAPVEGYSAFGSYTGNGDADGPFVYTGMRPAFVLIKNSSAAANWMLYDTARNPSNEAPYVLGPNNSDGGQTYDAYSGSYPIDILSNGFKPRSTLSNINGDGNTLIYACFSEHPFKTARAR